MRRSGQHDGQHRPVAAAKDPPEGEDPVWTVPGRPVALTPTRPFQQSSAVRYNWATSTRGNALAGNACMLAADSRGMTVS